MTEKLTINDLRGLVGNTDEVVYVKYHTHPWDMGGGHFMWRNDNPLLTDASSYFANDNDGTLIQARNPDGTLNNNGRWVRQYNEFINVAFFGACKGLYATDAIQAAIDFAANNVNFTNPVNTPPTKGSAILIPGGSYIVNELTLKYGISLIGHSVDQPIIYAALPDDPGYSTGTGYLINIGKDVIQIEVSNINFFGRDSTKGCINLRAFSSSVTTDGGLWHSNFKNLKITNFRGHGIFSEGGGNLQPNQFSVFELINVELSRNAPITSRSLKMTGQNGQMTFINSGFNGYNYNDLYHKGYVIEIAHSPSELAAYPAAITFINSTFQMGDYGVYINYAENITFDTCWFERLGVAIIVNGESNECRNINILNNRFADAAGYGGAPAPNNLNSNCPCIRIINARVTVANNFLLASHMDNSSILTRILTNSFLIVSGHNAINPGVEVFGNAFLDSRLNQTSGVSQVITSISNNTISIGYNKYLYVNTTSMKIHNIRCSLIETETFYLRANGGSITFTDDGNIYLTGRQELTLINGEVAGFTKIGYNLYQLTSLVRSVAP
jgi:hypothetical protein